MQDWRYKQLTKSALWRAFKLFYIAVSTLVTIAIVSWAVRGMMDYDLETGQSTPQLFALCAAVVIGALLAYLGFVVIRAAWIYVAYGTAKEKSHE